MKNHVISKICEVRIDSGLERLAQIGVILNKATKDDALVSFNTTVWYWWTRYLIFLFAESNLSFNARKTRLLIKKLFIRFQDFIKI